MANGFHRFRRHSREGQRAADLLAKSGEYFHLSAGMLVRGSVLDVDNTDDAVPGNDRSRKKRLETIFRQLAKVFESRIFIGFAGDCQKSALACHPAGETFVELEADFADFCFVMSVRRAKDEFVAIAKIDEAGIALGKLYYQ